MRRSCPSSLLYIAFLSKLCVSRYLDNYKELLCVPPLLVIFRKIKRSSGVQHWIYIEGPLSLSLPLVKLRIMFSKGQKSCPSFSSVYFFQLFFAMSSGVRVFFFFAEWVKQKQIGYKFSFTDPSLARQRVYIEGGREVRISIATTYTIA